MAMQITVKDEAIPENPPVVMTVEESGYGVWVLATLASHPDDDIAAVKVDYFNGKLRIFYWNADRQATNSDPREIVLLDDITTWKPPQQVREEEEEESAS